MLKKFKLEAERLKKEEERVKLEQEAQKTKDEMWQLEFERRKLEEESKIAQEELEKEAEAEKRRLAEEERLKLLALYGNKEINGSQDLSDSNANNTPMVPPRSNKPQLTSSGIAIAWVNKTFVPFA